MTDRGMEPGARRRSFLGMGGTGYLFLASMLCAIAVQGLLPAGAAADLAYVAICLAAFTALIAGVRRNAPLARGAWILVGLCLGLLATGNFLATASRLTGLPDLRPVADVMFMAAYLPLLFAAYRFGRGMGRSDRTVVLDAGILGLAALPVVWELIVEPNLPAGGLTGEALFALAIPVVDVVLVSLAAPVLLLRSSRSSSAYLFVAALLAMAAGDTLYALDSLVPGGPASLVANAWWLASYSLIGAAALVPSARDLGAATDPSFGRGDVTRTLAMAIGTLTVPIVILQESVLVGASELALFAIVAVALAGLVVARLHWTIRELAGVDRRFRRFMGHSGFVAIIKDGAGRYVYMNEVAQRLRRADDRGWFGRTDAELYPEHAERRAQADAEVRRTGRPKAGLVEADGRTWHTERFPMPGNTGEVGVLGLDVTDNVRAMETMRFQARLLESVRDAVVVIGLDGRVTYWNDGAREIFGYASAEMVGRTVDRVLAPGTEVDGPALWEAIERGEIETFEWRGLRRDGSSVWMDARVSPIEDDAGTPTAFLVVAKDITPRKETQLELARLGVAIDHATEGVIVTDPDDRVIYVNPAFERMSGFDNDDLRNRPLADVAGQGAFARAVERARREHIAGRSIGGWRGDLTGRRRDGSDLVTETTISPIDVDGQAGAGCVTIVRDVTRERAAEVAADRRARERQLISETLSTLRPGATVEETGASICRQLIKVPEVAIASIVTFDADGNATVVAQVHRAGRGEPGKRLTRERSDYLRERANAGPWVERWNPQREHPYRELFAELDILAHAYAPILLDRRPIGVLIWGSDYLDAVDRMTERLPALVEFAALARTLLGPAIADRNVDEAERRDLREVLEARRYWPVFQPIVELATTRIVGYEGLTRFVDGAAPDQRFEAARRLGVGVELERACLRSIFDAARSLPPEIGLNVNVSPDLILAGVIGELLPEDGRHVTLEVTEHQAVEDYAALRTALAPIQERVGVAVDDAGAGFSSLRHVVELTPAMVKLDRSLVAGIDADPARTAVVAGMVRFARGAHHVLLAEGIETQAELATLRDLGVRLGQGYLLGRPAALPGAALSEVPAALAPDPAGVKSRVGVPESAAARRTGVARKPRATRSTRAIGGPAEAPAA